MKGKYPQKTVNIELSTLQLGVYTPRTSYSPRYIQELAESIENEGQHKPILVQFPPEKGEKYRVIDGEYRVRALQKLERSLIRAEVRKLTDEEAMFLALRINQLHGKRLEPMEEALHIKKMMETQKLTQQQIATKFRKSQKWVSLRLSLVYSLTPKVQDDVRNRFLSSTHALEISKLPKDKQDKVAEFVSKEKPSVKETKYLVELTKKEPSKAQKLATSDLAHLKADMKHEEVIEAAARFDELMKAAKEPWQEEHVCLHCGFKFKVNWEEGTIKWESEPSDSTT